MLQLPTHGLLNRPCPGTSPPVVDGDSPVPAPLLPDVYVGIQWGSESSRSPEQRAEQARGRTARLQRQVVGLSSGWSVAPGGRAPRLIKDSLSSLMSSSSPAGEQEGERPFTYGNRASFPMRVDSLGSSPCEWPATKL